MKRTGKIVGRALIGTMFLIVGLEITLRAAAPFRRPQPPLVLDHASETILFLSDQNEPGKGPTIAESLGRQLGRRNGGHEPSVTDFSQIGWNTSEAFAALPEELYLARPQILIFLIGDANFWNRHHLGNFLDRRRVAFAFLREFEVARLFENEHGELCEPASSNSNFFYDVPLTEVPTLAMRWTGFLLAHREHLNYTIAPVADEGEAEYALYRWLKDPESGNQPLAARALADVLHLQGRDKDHEFLSELRKKYDVAGNPFREPARFPNFQSEARKLWESDRREEAERVLRESFRLNPFFAGGEPPSYENFRYLPEERFRALLAEAMPPPAKAWEKPGLRTIRESFLGEDVSRAWLRDDLGALVRRARAWGTNVIFATYPPDRFAAERRANAEIRLAAQELGVPVVDVASEVRRRTGARLPEGFFAAGDRLGARGADFVARILVDGLVDRGIVR